MASTAVQVMSGRGNEKRELEVLRIPRLVLPASIWLLAQLVG